VTFWINPNNLQADILRSGNETAALIARCRLKEAKKWFAHRGWEVLPQGERGQRILQWGADQAWLAAPGNPQTSVRRWCRKWAPRLTVTELNRLVVDTEHSNKRWSSDQCAAVLEISITDRTNLKLWHLGANDDPHYEVRLDNQRAKSAERSRRYRAARSTGAKRGRPNGAKPWEARGISKRTYYRRKARGETQVGTENASRPIIDIDTVTELESHRETSGVASEPQSIQIDTGNQRKLASHHSKTVIGRKDARCRESTGLNIYEEDHVLNAQIGEIERTIGHKSRMSPGMPMRRIHRDIARETGRDNAKHHFETFINHNLANGRWSRDWTEAWRNWCLKSLAFDDENEARRRKARFWSEAA
jgi:hypothetical protein